MSGPNRIFREWLRGRSAAVFMLAAFVFALAAFAAPCNDGCSEDAPSCECLCGCYANAMDVPTCSLVPSATPTEHLLQSEPGPYSLFLTSDIFRPPTA